MVERYNHITDAVERGMAEVRAQTTVSLTDSYKLKDIDGIGPATAEKLNDAGIETAEQLSRVTPNQLEMIDGIGAKKADQLSRQFQYSRTRFDSPSDGVPEDVEERMAERSPEARQADRSFNAPLTFDEEQWLEDPNRWDYPGVDNIPAQRRAERTKEKAQRGSFNIDASSIPGRASGRQAGGTVQVDVGGSFDPVSTVAHEVGHAAESSMAGRGGISETLFEDEQVREEAEELAVRRRKMATSFDSIEAAYDERDIDSELFADAFATATEEPRAAKRMAPNLFRKLQDETILDFGRF